MDGLRLVMPGSTVLRDIANRVAADRRQRDLLTEMRLSASDVIAMCDLLRPRCKYCSGGYVVPGQGCPACGGSVESRVTHYKPPVEVRVFGQILGIR